MAECPGGGTNRGTRSQFRLGLPGLNLCRGFYPVNMADFMDAGQSSQPGIAPSRDLISPSKGTRTLTVREYEQTIGELKKENFDLKLKIYMLEEAMKKDTRKGKENVAPDQEIVQVVVKLNTETENLRNELSCKEKLLQDALERAEKFEIDFKELQQKYSDLQSELDSLSELKEEHSSVLEEKECLIKHVEFLEKTLSEKEEEINTINQKIEILADSNNMLEEKIKRRSLAIQGFVYKNYKEKEMLPDELKNIVISATQAAKNGEKEEFAVAVKRTVSALNQIMSSSLTPVKESGENENIESPQIKCLKEGVLEKAKSAKSFSSSQTKSPVELTDIQDLREVLSERNILSTKSSCHLDSVDSYAIGKKMRESGVNIAEKDIVNCINFSTVSPLPEENLITFSNRPSSETCTVVEQKLIDIEHFPSSPLSSNMMHQEKDSSEIDVAVFLSKDSEESNQIMGLLKENKQLKDELTDKLNIIQNLRVTCKELSSGSRLQETGSDALKASTMCDVHAQTDIVGSNLYNEYEMMRIQKDAKLSDNVEKLREDILLLLLAIEDKNRELLEVKQTLSDVQEDLKKALNTTNVIDKDFYIKERNELHERLADSCAVNEELMRHLKNLEKFMEDLLANRFDSSRESISDKSDLFDSVSKCLNESLKLSNALSKHLSSCEGSKLFEECESFLQKSYSYSVEKSILSLPELHHVEKISSSYPRPHKSEEYVHSQKHSQRMQMDSNDSQLCWQSWQQMNLPSNQSAVSHQMQNDIPPKSTVCPSSDSDIWSEPDRDVSMQRIGISLQNSPVASKSPRRSKSKLKRSSCRFSFDQETTTSSERTSKRQNGSASRRLFSKECVKSQDFNTENFYFLVAEKYSRLKSLLEILEKVENEKDLSDEVNIVTSLRTAFTQLHMARENAKSSPFVCGNCVMLELFADIRHYRESDSFISNSSSEHEVLHRFSEEIKSLEDGCKSIFPQLFENVERLSQYAQSGTVSEDQVKTEELEEVIVDLNHKNKELAKKLDELKHLLSAEKKQLESVKTENHNLTSQMDLLKGELSDMKQKENELSLQNEKFVEELNSVNQVNSELNATLNDLEQKRRESSALLDQLTAELQKNKSDLQKMSEKCLEYEKKFHEESQFKEECENKLKILEAKLQSERNSYANQIDNLNAEKNNFAQELKSIQEIKLSLESENAAIKDNLFSKNNELLSLQDTTQKLLSAKDTLKSKNEELQTELKKTEQLVKSYQDKITLYEDEMIQLKENKSKSDKQLKELEAKTQNEKKKLLAEISELRTERGAIIKKMEEEKALFEKLQAEKLELDKKYAESCKNIASLKQLNEELKSKQLDLENRGDFFENAYRSSNSDCDSLNKDLKSLKETLQNLESKCLGYEKQLIATSGMKDTAVECLLNITNEFSSQRQKLNEMCKAYGFDTYVLWDEPSGSEYVPVIDKNNVQILCENICSETKKLSQSIDMLLGLLKSYHLKTIETKEKTSLKTMDMKKQLEMFKAESEHAKIQNNHLQLVISELQQSISEKEKSVQYSAREIQSLKEKLYNTEQEIERSNQLLTKKDDEITMLQERIFNLQTYVNSVLTDKTNVISKRNSLPDKHTIDSFSSDNQLPSRLVLRTSISCQTVNYGTSVHDEGESLSPTSPVKSPEGRNACCEKYWKKYLSLQSKLAVCQKHIEILEKEKNDLRENLLQQLKNKQDVLGTKDPDSSKLAELESKLEQKKAFISELKGELLKTCNSLIDKEKEVDNLKQKLSELEGRARQATFYKNDRHSMESPKSIEANIKTLRNHKWKLIQTIFDIQRKFYERRGIHLNYFDKFKDHVNNLYSLQLKNTISKSESMPLLKSYSIMDHYEQSEDKVKDLASLELDIECLENLKIFLNRFFVPCVLQSPKLADRKMADSKVKKLSTDKLYFQADSEELKESKLEMPSGFSILCPEVFRIDYSADQTLEGETASFDIFASTLSYQLDMIQKFFVEVGKCDWIEILNLSAKESPEKAEVKSLILQILQDIKDLHETAHKVFRVNAVLKKFDCISLSLVPLNTCGADVSDKESIMSEETIAISRSESPVSFEDVCPIELPHPETLHVEEEALKPLPTENRLSVSEPYGPKTTTAIGSSCDSVCPRSHYSSPDLGIESDPNHDSSAPEQKEDATNKYQKLNLEEQKFRVKSQHKTSFMSTESAGRWSGHEFGDSLYAIGMLQHYELLKQEIKESLVAIKSVLSRTGDGLHHIARYTSPRKTLEYNTLKSIKDTCMHIEVCLKEANNVVGKFWTAPCPTEKEWKLLNEENQSLQEQFAKLKVILQKQENEYKRAMGKLEHAQIQKASMEKKISKKLVKTKKVIRQAELKLLENRCQNFPPLPKYPSSQVEQAKAQ